MLAAIGLFLATANSQLPITFEGQLVHPRNLLVKYTDKSVLLRLRELGRVVRTMPQIQYAVLESRPGQLQLTRNRARGFGGVARVDLDRCALPAYDPNDEFWPDEWHMKAIHSDLAWDVTKGDPSVVVAVIDTGVFTDHPDLASNIWVNTGEVPGNNIDDDNDGYVDDVNGYDFSHNDGVPDDVYGHGTACAGIVAGVQDNAIGVSGVAPHCKLMALKASTDDGFFYDSNNVAAYLFAADHGARVLSMSFFSDRVSQSERDAIEYCWSHGVLPVAAAGNAASVFPYYPSAYEHTLSVAAVDGNLNKAGFSNYGSWVDVSAPGTGIYTTTRTGGYTSGFGGTSGACPHVAGIAALCFSMNPSASNAQVRVAIEDTAALQSQAPFGEFSNYGLVDAQLAVQRMAGGTAPTKPSVVRWASRYSSSPFGSSTAPWARLYGRRIGQAQIYSNGNLVPTFSSSTIRDYIDVRPQFLTGNVVVKVGGVEIANFNFPPAPILAWPLTEASTQSATLTGGFVEALNPDAQAITCTRRSDGSVLLQGDFRLVDRLNTMKLTIRRQYTGTTVGTETVQLYDWSSASYPYGNFVTVGSGPVPTAMTTSTFTVNNFSRFVDPEGTAYLLITTSTDLPSGAQLKLDQAKLEQ